MAIIEQVYGNTFRIVTRSMCVPFYRLTDEEIVLMDSGFFTEGDELEAALEEKGYRVRAILTSHVHYDHVGNHNRFQKKYGAEVYMTAFDAGISQSTLTLQACFYTNTVTDLAEYYPFMICRPDHILPLGADSVVIDGAVFRILDLPGHAHGHVGFLTPDNVAYVGDLLMSVEDMKYVPMLFGQCWTAALNSIDAICETDCRAYILAHNAVYEDIHAVAEANRGVIESQAEEVLSHMQAEWRSRGELAAIMVQRKVHRMDKGRIRMMERIVHSTLNYLEDTGRIDCDLRDGGIYYRAVPVSGEEGSQI